MGGRENKRRRVIPLVLGIGLGMPAQEADAPDALLVGRYFVSPFRRSQRAYEPAPKAETNRQQVVLPRMPGYPRERR